MIYVWEKNRPLLQTGQKMGGGGEGLEGVQKAATGMQGEEERAVSPPTPRQRWLILQGTVS